MKCVILQPSYIPWRGVFHQIQKADVFVFYDDAQYDKHGWRNRNRVKGPAGGQWLTIPVKAKGNVIEGTPINQISICREQKWGRKHWETIRQLYRKTPHFARYAPDVEEFLLSDPENLAGFTIRLTEYLARELGIVHTRFVLSSQLPSQGAKTDRLLGILKAVGATHYISGPAARSYLEEDKLAAAGISLEYMSYQYPEYPQLHPPFDSQVSILDLLFMTGHEAPRYIWDQPTGDVDRRSEAA